MDRPDVKKAFKDFKNLPLKTGFNFVLPKELVRGFDKSKLRIFALLKSNEACELPH